MLDVSNITSCEIGRGREATVYVVDFEQTERLYKTNNTSTQSHYLALRIPHVQKNISGYTKIVCAMPKHANIVYVHAVDGLTGQMLLEYVGGGTLEDELVCTTVSSRRAVVVIAQVLGGVAHLHTHGLIHGDIGPRNVLVSENGKCKLTDYFAEPNTYFAACGAPAYMAPEAARGEVVQASDVWSVGCLMLAVTGRPPWQDGEVKLENGSIVDLRCAATLLFHLACREIALRGPPEFTTCADSCTRLFFDVLPGVFTAVEGRVSARELLFKNKW